MTADHSKKSQKKRLCQEVPAEKEEFSTMLGECIQYVLKIVLGEKPAQIIFSRLQSLDISTNPRKFHDALYPVFKRGAVVLEKVIVKELFQRLNVPYEEKELFDFESEVNFAKQVFTSRMKEVPL